LISGLFMNFDPRADMSRTSIDSSGLDLASSAALLADTGVTELCINRPSEAFLETRRAGVANHCHSLIFEWCSRLAKLVANSTQQRVDETSPPICLSATGERFNCDARNDCGLRGITFGVRRTRYGPSKNWQTRSISRYAAAVRCSMTANGVAALA